MADPKNFVWDSEEFFEGAVAAEELNKSIREMIEKKNHELRDKIALKRDRAQSILGHQVVGAEVFT